MNGYDQRLDLSDYPQNPKCVKPLTQEYRGWTFEYIPKPGRPGIVDWDATHPDEEVMLNGKSIDDLRNQIDSRYPS